MEETSGERRIVAAWEATYSDPIVVDSGDVVSVGERGSEWDGWLWCTGPGGREGWIPAEFLARRAGEWICLADYSAVELSIAEGETVRSHESVAGWEWCEKPSGEKGWIPSENLSE